MARNWRWKRWTKGQRSPSSSLGGVARAGSLEEVVSQLRTLTGENRRRGKAVRVKAWGREPYSTPYSFLYIVQDLRSTYFRDGVRRGLGGKQESGPGYQSSSNWDTLPPGATVVF